MIFKKTPVATGILFSSMLLLSACGNEDEVTEPITDETSQPADGVEDANPSGSLSQGDVGGEVFGFVDFDLDVDLPDQDDALQVSYDEDRDKVEAEYENKSTNENLQGNDAFDKIEPLLAELQLTADMADDEVINKAIEVFSIEDGYKSIDIEVTYPDGTEKDYEARGN
ncbi:YusW family protein [Planococcus beigongshangi]|uniref:YusW family protein n=1 Tax=Planococcus beigongshangi TaxID=2782536 RepID=UPI001EEE9E39|nr:YusW family protein [Planococcus beigongshangi]